ncbi:hypothetical protein EDC01DRAFT_380196 [Geopyxis carbonaria]|nr:hypothetical protein EDC01DRAFT_380196 [Geopyxis carbonaria]
MITQIRQLERWDSFLTIFPSAASHFAITWGIFTPLRQCALQTRRPNLHHLFRKKKVSTAQRAASPVPPVPAHSSHDKTKQKYGTLTTPTGKIAKATAPPKTNATAPPKTKATAPPKKPAEPAVKKPPSPPKKPAVKKSPSPPKKPTEPAVKKSPSPVDMAPRQPRPVQQAHIPPQFFPNRLRNPSPKSPPRRGGPGGPMPLRCAPPLPTRPPPPRRRDSDYEFSSAYTRHRNSPVTRDPRIQTKPEGSMRPRATSKPERLTTSKRGTGDVGRAAVRSSPHGTKVDRYRAPSPSRLKRTLLKGRTKKDRREDRMMSSDEEAFPEKPAAPSPAGKEQRKGSAEPPRKMMRRGNSPPRSRRTSPKNSQGRRSTVNTSSDEAVRCQNAYVRHNSQLFSQHRNLSSSPTRKSKHRAPPVMGRDASVNSSLEKKIFGRRQERPSISQSRSQPRNLSPSPTRKPKRRAAAPPSNPQAIRTAKLNSSSSDDVDYAPLLAAKRRRNPPDNTRAATEDDTDTASKNQKPREARARSNSSTVSEDWRHEQPKLSPTFEKRRSMKAASIRAAALARIKGTRRAVSPTMRTETDAVWPIEGQERRSEEEQEPPNRRAQDEDNTQSQSDSPSPEPETTGENKDDDGEVAPVRRRTRPTVCDDDE